MDDKLKNSLWNVILARLFGQIAANQYGEIRQDYHIFINLHRNFFKLPMDELEKHLSSRREWYKDCFLSMEWPQVCDFFEFVANRMIPFDAQEWERQTNLVFESENVPYRLISSCIIACDHEDTWESLRETVRLLQAQKEHEQPAAVLTALKAALAALGLRPEPDLPCVHASCQQAARLASQYILDPAAPTADRPCVTWVQRVLAEGDLCRPDWLRHAAQTAFVGEVHNTLVDAADAHALVGLTSMFVAALLRQGAHRGRITLAQPQEPRPSQPDPWGESHRRARSQD